VKSINHIEGTKYLISAGANTIFIWDMQTEEATQTVKCGSFICSVVPLGLHHRFLVKTDQDIKFVTFSKNNKLRENQFVQVEDRQQFSHSMHIDQTGAEDITLVTTRNTLKSLDEGLKRQIYVFSIRKDFLED
jgi:hypothetical protein